ncbi:MULTISPECIES: D-alanyl-D-alanine carboxypeptidase [Nitrosomonas]|uniref:Transposase IS200 family protein n=1 Tax=Nitrosomonas communis TaxID=44574 RepID=A0A5D3YI84_9PROT|nr:MULTISPECIES: D-alanyl-D-alanine carboxypeptidase [Nitrosomonas]TYP93275.1 transposase IS200 family protein [Nitrosomonas communis]UVS62192.1 D-alanyl-D-alanine carboxypeptidase [Nitrosomonas sp. PLL12]
MTNHVHLLLSADRTESAGELMKALGQRYVQYVNRTYQRSGTLWEGRFRSCLIQEEDYLLACQRYIELNPVRAGMVAHPAEYRWSSYGVNAQGEANALVKPHSLYVALGLDNAGRQMAYRELFRDELESSLVDDIRRATNGNFALGNERLDGWGLSRTERISASQMGELLIAAFHSPVMPEFISSLPIAGVDGTMKSRFKETLVAGRAHMKTGTLNEVATIAGYLLDHKTRRNVVVFFINHAQAANARTALDTLIRWVYERA